MSTQPSAAKKMLGGDFMPKFVELTDQRALRRHLGNHPFWPFIPRKYFSCH
jgi:hypothetical protein